MWTDPRSCRPGFSEAGKSARSQARCVLYIQMSDYEKYYAVAREQLDMIFTTQRAAIDRAATWLGEALANVRCQRRRATGHTHMLAEEIFYRAGGLAHAVPILDENLFGQ